jgi:hypothetical protein
MLNDLSPDAAVEAVQIVDGSRIVSIVQAKGLVRLSAGQGLHGLAQTFRRGLDVVEVVEAFFDQGTDEVGVGHTAPEGALRQALFGVWIEFDGEHLDPILVYGRWVLPGTPGIKNEQYRGDVRGGQIRRDFATDRIVGSEWFHRQNIGWRLILGWRGRRLFGLRRGGTV